MKQTNLDEALEVLSEKQCINCIWKVYSFKIEDTKNSVQKCGLDRQFNKAYQCDKYRRRK